MTAPDTPVPDVSFDDVGVSRRQFVRLSAAVGGALALPGAASAAVGSETMDAEYEFVVNHTPRDHAVPTLATFSDPSGVEAFDALADDAVTTTEPRPAAYAQLTTDEAVAAADIPTAETLSYSPGSNPFWRLGYYPLGVFPEARRSVDYIDYEQMIDGMERLADEHADRLSFFPIGDSPGHLNRVTDREDPKDIYVAEVTNDVGDREAFAEKTKVFYNLSLHGDERAGVEAGCRFIEGLLRGNETETESLLDDLVLLFCFSNPDGWVARHPQYDAYGVPGAPVHERGNAAGVDTNRQFPIYGWIDPVHYPGEPNGANHVDDDPGIDRDVPQRTVENAADTLAIVEHFRGYDNLEYGADFHGMLYSDEFVLGLISQDQLTNRRFHELYEMNRVIDTDLEAALETWTTAGDTQQTATGDVNPFDTLPTEAFDYANSWDTIGYTGTGYVDDWMAHPEPVGLDMTTMAFEMAYSNIVGGNAFVPENVRMQVTGYRAAIRTVAEYATEDVTSTVESDGESVAYVTTDRLQRSSEDLSFVESDEDTEATTTTETATLAPGGAASLTFEAPAGDALSVHPHVEAGLASAQLRDPDGRVVRTFDPDDGAKAGGRCCGMANWRVNDPAAGEWTVELEGVRTDRETPAEVTAATLAAEGPNPDPEPVLGYEQRPYEVDPLNYFDDLDDAATGPVEAVTPEAVAGGALSDYDHLVVVHDDGLGVDGYVDAVDRFVEDDGNLVVTDSGVNLVGAMDADLVSGVAPDDVTREELYIAHLTNRVEDHPLLTDTRPIQRELWKVTPLGYSTGIEAPMYLLDEAAFSAAGGTVAGRTEGQVAAGSIVRDSEGTGVHVVGGLLPPAKQTNLHPFGVLDYAVAFLGHVMLTNALGFVQTRRVNGQVVTTFGEGVSFEGPGLSVSGTRTDDGDVYTAGEKNRVELTVDASDSVQVRDTMSIDWDVIEPPNNSTIERVERPGDGTKRLYFSADGTESFDSYYVCRAPSGAGTEIDSGQYDFGPVEVSADGGETWQAVSGTAKTVVVVARESRTVPDGGDGR